MGPCERSVHFEHEAVADASFRVVPRTAWGPPQARLCGRAWPGCDPGGGAGGPTPLLAEDAGIAAGPQVPHVSASIWEPQGASEVFHKVFSSFPKDVRKLPYY